MVERMSNGQVIGYVGHCIDDDGNDKFWYCRAGLWKTTKRLQERIDLAIENGWHTSRFKWVIREVTLGGVTGE
jgi:hypothetical protein